MPLYKVSERLQDVLESHRVTDFNKIPSERKEMYITAIDT
jgi:hypothetical protein